MNSRDGARVSSSRNAGKQTPDSDLAAMVSHLVHEFRTPLGSIVGAASTLDEYADDIDAATRSKLCAGIVAEAQQLDHLLTGLSVLAKARTGLLIDEESKVELNELLRGLSTKVRLRYGRPVTISVLPGDIILKADPAALQALVFTMLDLADIFAADDGRLDLSLFDDGRFAELALASGVRHDDAGLLSQLLDGLPTRGRADAHVAAHAVFLAAIQEVVHILGGEISLQHDSSAADLRQTVRLPKHPA